MCVVEFCGDGVTNNTTEICDDGVGVNGTVTSSCTTTCVLKTEVCDGIDNDLDGQIDE